MLKRIICKLRSTVQRDKWYNCRDYLLRQRNERCITLTHCCLEKMSLLGLWLCFDVALMLKTRCWWCFDAMIVLFRLLCIIFYMYFFILWCLYWPFVTFGYNRINGRISLFRSPPLARLQKPQLGGAVFVTAQTKQTQTWSRFLNLHSTEVEENDDRFMHSVH